MAADIARPDARGRLLDVNHDGGKVAAVAVASPAMLLARPAQKAAAWDSLKLFNRGRCQMKIVTAALAAPLLFTATAATAARQVESANTAPAATPPTWPHLYAIGVSPGGERVRASATVSEVPRSLNKQ